MDGEIAVPGPVVSFTRTISFKPHKAPGVKYCGCCPISQKGKRNVEILLSDHQTHTGLGFTLHHRATFLTTAPSCLLPVDLSNWERGRSTVLEVNLGNSYMCLVPGLSYRAIESAFPAWAWWVEMWRLQYVPEEEERDLVRDGMWARKVCA